MQPGSFDPSNNLSDTLYADLQAIARSRFNRLAVTGSIQATDLLHEAWAKLATREWIDREHFVSTFARAAQQVLIDIARRSERRHRHLGPRAAIDPDMADEVWHDPVGHPDEFLLLHEAVEELRGESPAVADQLLLHLLLDVPTEVIAASQRPPASTRSVQRNIRTAKTWIHSRLTDQASA